MLLSASQGSAVLQEPSRLSRSMTSVFLLDFLVEDNDSDGGLRQSLSRESPFGANGDKGIEGDGRELGKDVDEVSGHGVP